MKIIKIVKINFIQISFEENYTKNHIFPKVKNIDRGIYNKF